MDHLPRHLLASSPAVIYACKAGDDYGATYISDNVQELLGYRPDEFLDNSAFWKDHIHPDDLNSVLDGLKGLFETGRHIHEYRFRASSGEYRWMRDELRLARNEATGGEELVGSWLDITDRKTMEEKYRRFAGLTSDYIHYCTRTGTTPFRVQWIDGAFNPISGYGIDDILARGCWLPLVHPDDRQMVSDYLAGLFPGDRRNIEFRIVTKDNEIRWVSEKSHCEAGASPGDVVLFGAVTDITERKRLEMALQDSEGFLREASKIARLGRWRWNIATNEIDWSSILLEMFDLAALGRAITYADFIGAVHPDDRGMVETAVKQALDYGRDYAVEYRVVHGDGSMRYVQAKGQVHYGADGKPTQMIGTALDVTEQKLLEERLLESDHLKSEFIATASHELRTPLSVIQGYAELLLDEGAFDAGQQREFLAVIHDKSLALERIVDDLLDVSRVETGRVICLEYDRSPIVQELRKVVAHFQREACGHRFSLRLPEEEVFLSVDQAKIIQVLENLLGNAVKFSPRGSEITVNSEILGEEFRIAVKDEGIGIPPEKHEQIFDKFFRVDAADTAVPGLGIGLYLVRKIIEAHRGRVWVESSPGKGTTFFLTLPLGGLH